MLAKIEKGEHATAIECRELYFILESKLAALKMKNEYSIGIWLTLTEVIQKLYNGLTPIV